MRFFEKGSLDNQKTRLQIFIFLSAAPVLILFILGFVFYKINKLSELTGSVPLYREDIIDSLEMFHGEVFYAGLLSLIVIILQVLLLTGLIKKILPSDKETNLDAEDKKTLSKVKVSKFDEVDKK